MDIVDTQLHLGPGPGALGHVPRRDEGDDGERDDDPGRGRHHRQLPPEGEEGEPPPSPVRALLVVGLFAQQGSAAGPPLEEAQHRDQELLVVVPVPAVIVAEGEAVPGRVAPDPVQRVIIAAGYGVPELPAWTLGYVYVPAFLGISVTSVFAAPLGAKVAHRLPVGHLKKVFALFILALAAKLFSSL